MRKRTYEKPSLSVENFTADEYVAACNGVGTSYGFNCNAGDYLTRYNAYLADGTSLAHATRDNDFDDYRPCNAVHSAEVTSDFLDGYITEQFFTFNRETKKWEYSGEGAAIPVKIWTENGKNVHCTTELEIKNWAILKS